MAYDHITLEQKWQKYWEENKVFKTENPVSLAPFVKGDKGDLISEQNPQSLRDSSFTKEPQKPKKYILDMFPYPSGAGLHVGHPKGYTATDIVSRYYHANGYNVLHPMGFDAFGLPAENYAVKTGTHPKITTEANIAVFTQQMKALGFSYDWDRMVDTTDPEYYRWTQWIFLELFKKGLAYEAEMPVNWCPVLKAVLANEEVVDGKSEIGGHPVEKKLLRQWVLRITNYADRLITDLDTIDWPEGIKEMQRNWIGKSEGCEFRLMKKIEGKPVALILHGWEDDGVPSVHFHSWQRRLQKELENAGYEVIMPSLPDPTRPNLEKQLEFLEQYKSKMSEDSLIIGHSMGGFLAMHFAERLEQKISKLICVAPIFDGLIDTVDWSCGMSEESWNIGSASMRKSYNPETIRKNVHDWQVFLSTNDPYIPYLEAKKYFDTLGIAHSDKENAGHFNDRDGATVDIFLDTVLASIRVYTTRVDTVYGMTYAVMAPDHRDVGDFITIDQRDTCEQYIREAKGKSDQDRTNEGKEKTGVWTGSYVINPYNGESVPLWIADYVLGSYGTGAVMAVPAHDERDFEFALKYDLPMKQSIAPYVLYKGNRTPKKDAETLERTTTIAFIEYEGKFLLAKEQNQYMICIGGGLDEGETPLDAIRREMIEETGFYDFESITPIMNTELYADSYSEKRGKNIVGYDSICFHIKLKSLDAHAVSDEERSARELFWFEKDEVAGKLDWITHQIQWKQFIQPSPITQEGYLVNSSEYNKLSSSEARKIFSEKAETEGFGHKKVNYKLRDWLFSRQRYWGEPIPLIHISDEDYAKLPREKGIGAYIETREEKEFLIIDGKEFSEIYTGLTGKLVIDSSLPLLLPEVEKYEPSADGHSPLANVTEWVNIRLAPNLVGKRETNTMPQWGGSCWYYLRYMDSKNSNALASRDAMDYWGMVDEYVGGAEHAVLHLLYARFWHKVLYDIGVVPTLEPFQKLTNVGLILGPDGQKMSKSRGNVINPNDIVSEYGADTLRLYEMSMGAFTDPAPWNTEAIVGVRRFLDRAYATFTEGRNIAKDEMKAMKLLHKTVKKVGEDIVEYKFNTALSSLMILLNEGLPTDPEFVLEWKEKFSIMLHPFAPHMAEELWSGLGKSESIYSAEWPTYDEWMLVDDEVTIAVQVNGKLRGTLTCMNGVMQEEVSTLAHENPDIAKWIDGKTLVKEIFIPNKMLSIVVKE